MQLQVATLLAAVMMSEGAEPDSCVTVSQQRCRFPFTFNNTEYSACTGAGHPIGRPWCYTAEVISAANRLIGEVVQSRRRPLLGPSPG